MANEPSKARGSGRVSFLAHADTFREMLAAGHSMRAIYEEYKDRLGFGYPYFTKSVTRYLGKGKDDGHQRKNEQIRPAPAGPASAGDGTAKQRERQDGKPAVFAHNASGGNDRDDLI